jgi:hypothetical protein
MERDDARSRGYDGDAQQTSRRIGSLPSGLPEDRRLDVPHPARPSNTPSSPVRVEDAKRIVDWLYPERLDADGRRGRHRASIAQGLQSADRTTPDRLSNLRRRSTSCGSRPPVTRRPRRGRNASLGAALTGLAFRCLVVVLQLAIGQGLISTPPKLLDVLASFEMLLTQERLLQRVAMTCVEMLSAALVATLIGGRAAGRFIGGHKSGSRIQWIVGLSAAPSLLLYPLFLVMVGRNSVTVVSRCDFGLAAHRVEDVRGLTTSRQVLLMSDAASISRRFSNSASSSSPWRCRPLQRHSHQPDQASSRSSASSS